MGTKILSTFMFTAAMLGCSDRESRPSSFFSDPGAPGGPSPRPPSPSPSRDAGFSQPDAGLLGNLTMRLGETVERDTAPPPISGGTLLALRDGHTFVAADSDRDTVWIVDLPTRAVRSVALQAGDEPGRVEEGDDGAVFVALRRGGAVVTIDLATASITARRAVCPAPRGLAWDATRHELLVACAGGEFASLPAAGEARITPLDDDLRDVVIWRDRRFVSRFRSAELLEVDLEGRVIQRSLPPLRRDARGNGVRLPGVAWRTLAHPSLGVVMLHQTSTTAPLDVRAPDGGVRGPAYGGGGPLEGRGTPCVEPLVSTAITAFYGDERLPDGVLLPQAILAVDLAAKDGLFVVATPGNSFEGAQTSTFGLPLVDLSQRCPEVRRNGIDDGLQQAVAVAISVDNRVVAQYRERPGLMVQDGVRTFIPFPDAVSVRDTGHAVFHAGTPTGLACASCHPEGGEDGRTWNFIPLGARRTPTMRGATSATAPFHWDGDQRDLTHLLGDVFAGRMGAGELNPAQRHALSHWIDGLPTLHTHATADADTLARGRAVFEGPAGCADCHSGAALTNNDTVDVGTGGRFQVPQLHGLAARAPYLHDGRAATLDLRLMMNDGDLHGHTSTLTPEQRADLLRYLTSL